MSTGGRADAAFDHLVGLGPQGTLVQLHAVLRTSWPRPPSLRTLENWSARYGWQARLAQIERHAREAADREHAKWVHDHRERLRKEGLLLQQRGLEWLRFKEPDVVRAGDAIRAIEAGFRLEALALGEVTERIHVEEHDERLERLSDGELARLIRATREDEDGRPNRTRPEGP